MIEQSARVLDTDGDSILLATERQSGCHSCDVKGGCGTSLIGSLFPNRPQQQLRLPLGDLSPPPSPGDRVTIGIDEGYLQSSTLLLYAVPLLGLMGGAVFGSLLGNAQTEEPMSILFGLLGLSLGLIYNRYGAAQRSGKMAQYVKVLRVETRGIAVPLNTDILP